MTKEELIEAAKAAVERWNALPEDERNGDRPWIMGWNAGYEHAQEEIERLTAQVERMREMTDRQILINLIASLSLADHMGDVANDAETALKRAGIPFNYSEYEGDEDWWPRLARWLAKEHGATTLYGTTFSDDVDDEEPAHDQ